MRQYEAMVIVLGMVTCLQLAVCCSKPAPLLSRDAALVVGATGMRTGEDGARVSFAMSKEVAQEFYAVLSAGTLIADDTAYAMIAGGEIHYSDGSRDLFSITSKDVVFIGYRPVRVNTGRLQSVWARCVEGPKTP